MQKQRSSLLSSSMSSSSGTKSSKFRGVSFAKRDARWIAYCCWRGAIRGQQYIGSFDSELGAAHAYDDFLAENNIDKQRNFENVVSSSELRVNVGSSAEARDGGEGPAGQGRASTRVEEGVATSSSAAASSVGGGGVVGDGDISIWPGGSNWLPPKAEGTRRSGVFGCGKCRWGPRGCKGCIHVASLHPPSPPPPPMPRGVVSRTCFYCYQTTRTRSTSRTWLTKCIRTSNDFSPK